MTPTLRTAMAVVAIIVLALAPVAPITTWADLTPETPPPTLVLQGTVRDFEYLPLVNAPNYNPDFQTDGGCGIDPFIVTDYLGDDGRPIFAGGSEACPTTHGAENFNMWFRDTPGWNVAVPHEITANLVEGSDPPRYQYTSNAFFPVDYAGWNGPSFTNKQLATATDGLLHNFSFTYQLHTRFTFNGGEVFDFRGDDDVWVFINGRKALDLGGLHPPENGSITLDEEFADTFALEIGDSYSFDLFFAERHTDSSSLGFTTSLELENPPLVSVDGVADGATYEFGNVPTPGCTADDPDAGTVSHPSPVLSDIEGPFSEYGVGSQTAACSYTGLSGLSGSASATYEITDTPVLIDPDDVTVEATGPGDETVTFADPQSSEGDALPVWVTCEPQSGSSFPFGATTVECTAMNGLELTSEPVTFTVTVVDTTAPVIDPTTNLSVAATGPDGAVVTYSSPAAVDLVDGARPTTCVPASGSTFPLGLTTVNCSASDTRENTSSTSFTVGVDDQGAPIVTVAPNTTVEATGAAGAIVTFADATAFDVVDGELEATCSPASGTTFALGSTTVTCSAMDRAENLGTNTLTVTVRDTTAPVIDPPADAGAEATGADGAIVTFADATAFDVVDGELEATCSPASGTTFALGSTTVTCSATDSRENTGSATFVVTVVDTTAPVVSPPANTAAEATGPGGVAVNYPAASASDIVAGTGLATSCSPGSGSMFGIGSTTVTCSATDDHANTGSATFTVTVRDTTAPVIDPTTNLSVAATGPDGAVVTYSSPAAVDLVDGARPTTCVPASGSTFPLGLTTVNCSASDTRENTSSTSFTVGVDDQGAPIVTVAPNTTVEATGAAGAIVTFADATAFDVVDGELEATCSPASGTTFALGSTTVTCSAMDRAENLGTNTLTVTVRDTTAPVIDPTTNLSVAATGPDGAVVTYSSPAAVDLVDGARPTTCVPASGSTFPLGLTTVNCSASDTRENTSSTSFTVGVDDQGAPIVTVAPNTTVEATGAAGAIVTFADATAFDVVDGELEATCSPASGTTFALGSTTVTCSAMDRAENLGTNTLTVTVVDTTPPTIGTVDDILTVPDSSGTATVNYTPPPATDNIAGELPVSCQPPSGFAFALGTTTVTCTATDPSGNSSSSRFRVVVDEPAQSVAATPLTVAPTTTTTIPAPTTTTTTVPAPTTTTTPPPTTPVLAPPTIPPNTAVLTAPSPTVAPAPATPAVAAPTPTPTPAPPPVTAPREATVLNQEFAAPAPPAPVATPDPITPATDTTLAVSTVDGQTTGRPGVTLAINATGYGQCHKVYFFFNGDRIGAATPDDSGRVTLNGASVPGGAKSGPGVVSSSCSESGTTLPDEAPFVVTDEALHRSALVTALSLPGQVSTDPVQLAVSAGIGVTLMAAIAFPAEIFNATLEENFSEIRSWFRLPAKAAAAATAAGQAKAFGLFSLAGGALFAALSPDFGLSLTTLALVVGMAGAVALTAIGFGIPANLVMRKTTGEWGRIGVLPGALVLAVACVGLSRLVGFQPGYLYGLVAGFTFRHELDKRRSGQLTAAGCLFMLFVSIGAWLLLDPVSRMAAAPDAGLWWISLEAGLASTFLIGLEGVAFGLLPLRFLNGSKIIAWSRVAWAGLFGLSLAAFVHIVLRPGSGFSSSTSSTRMVTVAAVSLLFVLASVGLWAYFRWRPERWMPERSLDEVEFADIERL